MAEGRHRWVALLRAVNVGGRATMRMADLRAQFEARGLTGVTTYIQTGNVLFSTTASDLESLARSLEKQLASSLGYQGMVFILSPAELALAAAANPFDPERLDKEQACHLLFLSAQPDVAHREALLALQGAEYRFAVRGKVLYYAYPRTLAGRRRTINMERVLGVAGTARGWKVVAKLIELASQSARVQD
ncbi:MAG: DUF1697 domain-containing protein [Chloroflexi bacterium]|nr:DUF1697 domain-containing protein [Chloroflexota bacterium]